MRYDSDSSTVGWKCEVCIVGGGCVSAAGTHLAAKTLDIQLQVYLSVRLSNCLFPLIVVWTIWLTFTAGIFAIFGQIERHLQHANWPLDKSISKRCQKQHCGCSTYPFLLYPRPCTACTQHLHFGTRQRGVRSAKGLNYRKSGFGATVQVMAYGLYIDLPTVFIVYHISNTQKLCVFISLCI